jgi:hypothetical protein
MTAPDQAAKTILKPLAGGGRPLMIYEEVRLSSAVGAEETGQSLLMMKSTRAGLLAPPFDF